MSLFKTEVGSLTSAVFLNELVLESIFSNLEVKSILSFRLVCANWKRIIDKKLSKEFCAHFQIKNDIHHIPRDLEVFENLKISKLELELKPSSNMFLTAELFKLLSGCGFQVKYLFLNGIITSKNGWNWVKNILMLTPNLETLVLLYTVESKVFCEVFQNFFHLNLRSLRLLKSHYPLKGSKEAFLQTVVKSFPNLETNFGIEEIDCLFLKLLASKGKNKISLKMRKFLNPGKRDFYHGKEIEFLHQLDSKVHPLVKLELNGVNGFDEERASLLNQALKNFSDTLEELLLIVEPIGTVEIEFPVLQQLRKLTLGTMFLTSSHLTWKIGQNISNKFPLLEYLIHTPGRYRFDEEQSEHFSKLSFKLFWKMWSFFVPEEETGSLEPLKYLTFVDLTIPKGWIGPEKNREWGQKFLKNYSKLYKNAGNREVVEGLTKWLQ